MLKGIQKKVSLPFPYPAVWTLSSQSSLAVSYESFERFYTCLNIHIYMRDIFWLFFPSFELVLRTIYYNKIFIADYIWDLNTSWSVTLLDSYYVLRIYWNHREVDGLPSGLLSRAKVCFPEILALNTIGIFPLSSFTLLEWLSHICYWVKNFLQFIFTECVSFLTEFEFLVVTLHGVVKNFFPAY